MKAYAPQSSPQSVEDVMRPSTELQSKSGNGENLQDSCMTAPTETGSISDDGSAGTGWFGGITADIKTLAFTLKETAGGVASFVQRSALAVASEIAHLEEEEMAHQLERSYEHQYDENVTLRLPWEVQVIGGGEAGESFHEDETLKQKIRNLSTKEETFLQPYSAKDIEGDNPSSATRPPFVLDEPRIRLVRRILDLDEKLAAMHARLSGRSDVKEAVFWQNYFYNCEMTREEYFVLLPHPTPLDAEIAGEMESFEDQATSTDGGDNESFIEVPSPPASQRSVGSIVVINGGTASAALDMP